MQGLLKTSLKSLPLVYSGKVRDSYAVGDDKLLIVATDRIPRSISSCRFRFLTRDRY